MQARDIMTTSIVKVGVETPIPAVTRLMAERRISGVPVVDVKDRLVGMVTESDVLRHAETGTVHGQTAGDVMTREVITVTPDTSLSAIVDVLQANRIKRVPVLEADKLVGIVSRGNLIQAMGSISPEASAPSNDDRRIRDEALAIFQQLQRGPALISNVIVIDGVVHLWGFVSTRDDQAALRIASEAISGVNRVEDHTTLVHQTQKLRSTKDEMASHTD
jgi:CBS domain-containing protein